jgi:hypothetical protein
MSLRSPPNASGAYRERKAFDDQVVVALGVALSGIQAQTASADVCYLALLKHGNWLAFVTPTECLTQLAEYDMWWFYLFALAKRLKGTEYCARVHAGEKGKYTNSECTTEGAGEFEKVKLQLPDIFPGLAGEKYPVVLEGSSAGSFTLETTGGQKVTGDGETVKLEAPETNATGSFTAKDTNVVTSGKKCKTAGAAEGEVKSSGSYQVVRLSKTTSAIGLLFLPSEYTMECSGTNIKVKGSMIANLSAGEESSELTSMELSLKGTGGKEEVTKYLNYEEEEITVHPEVNFGLGFVEADESLGAKVNLADGLTQMFKILGR